jgi:hypothetical protein
MGLSELEHGVLMPTLQICDMSNTDKVHNLFREILNNLFRELLNKARHEISGLEQSVFTSRYIHTI